MDSIKIKEYLHCNECSHKDVCRILNNDGNLAINIPDRLKSNIDITFSAKCKHFQRTVVFRDVNQYFPKIAPDPGTGIEYFNNQPTCTAEEDERLKSMSVLTQQKMLDDDSIAQIREHLMKG